VKEDDEQGSSFFSCFGTSAKKWQQATQLLIIVCDLSQVRKDDNKQCNCAVYYHRVIFTSVKEDIKLGFSSFSCSRASARKRWPIT
jgi:hypothetical protein